VSVAITGLFMNLTTVLLQQLVELE